MIRPIIRDSSILRQKSKPATAEDRAAAQDLTDTLGEHLGEMTGMAAIMIGERKRIIAVCNGPMIVTMLNPKILGGSGAYEKEEECSVLGTTCTVRRYRTIRVLWQDLQMKEHTAILDGFTAETVQHMIDHCNGKLV